MTRMKLPTLAPPTASLAFVPPRASGTIAPQMNMAPLNFDIDRCIEAQMQQGYSQDAATNECLYQHCVAAFQHYDGLSVGIARRRCMQLYKPDALAMYG